ncbi:14482_t:CDS:1, partial [Racocetra fulgida]
NPQAIGKLEFKDDNGDREYFFYKPLWVNEQSTTYNSLWTIDHNDKPSNAWADVWATVYWACQKENCASEYVHLRVWAP